MNREKPTFSDIPGIGFAVGWTLLSKSDCRISPSCEKCNQMWKSQTSSAKQVLILPNQRLIHAHYVHWDELMPLDVNIVNL